MRRAELRLIPSHNKQIFLIRSPDDKRSEIKDMENFCFRHHLCAKTFIENKKENGFEILKVVNGKDFNDYVLELVENLVPVIEALVAACKKFDMDEVEAAKLVAPNFKVMLREQATACRLLTGLRPPPKKRRRAPNKPKAGIPASTYQPALVLPPTAFLVVGQPASRDRDAAGQGYRKSFHQPEG